MKRTLELLEEILKELKDINEKTTASTYINIAANTDNRKSMDELYKSIVNGVKSQKGQL